MVGVSTFRSRERWGSRLREGLSSQRLKLWGFLQARSLVLGKTTVHRKMARTGLIAKFYVGI